MDDTEPFTLEEWLEWAKENKPGMLVKDPVELALERLDASDLLPRAKKVKALQPVQLPDGYTVQVKTKLKGNKVQYLFKDPENQAVGMYNGAEPLTLTERTAIGREIIKHLEPEAEPFFETIKASLNNQYNNLDELAAKNVKVKEHDYNRKLTADDVATIILTLQPLYLEQHRNDIVYYLSGYMRKEGIAKECAYRIIDELTKDDTDRNNRITVFNISYDKDIDVDKLAGIGYLHDIIDLATDDEGLRKQAKTALNAIRAPLVERDIIKVDTNTNMYIESDEFNIWHVYKRELGISNDGKILYHKERTKVAEACPKDVIVYQSPIEGEPRLFEMIWHSTALQHPIRIGPEPIDEIVGSLVNENLIGERKYINDVGMYLNGLIRQDLAETKDEIQHPGPFIKDGKLIMVKYPMEPPTTDQINNGLDILNELSNAFPLQRDKLSTCIKWGIVSPYSYARKQLKAQFIPDLLLYGWGGSGKSTMGEIGISLYCNPSGDNVIEGTGVTSPAQMGAVRSRTTFPLLADEIIGIFDKPDAMEVWKVAVTKLISRGKHSLTGRYQRIPAFSAMILTANAEPPGLSALRRRLELVHFGIPDAKEDRDKQAEFEAKFIKEVAPYYIGDLKYLGHAAFFILQENQDLLDMEWKDLAEELYKRIYTTVGRKVPEWLKQWAETENLSDVKDNTADEIRQAFIAEINDQYRKRIVNKEEPIHEEAKKLKPKYAYRDKAFQVLDEHYIPFMNLIEVKKEIHVVINGGVTKFLKDTASLDIHLTDVAALMNKTAKADRNPQTGKVRKGIRLSMTEFIDFLFE